MNYLITLINYYGVECTVLSTDCGFDGNIKNLTDIPQKSIIKGDSKSQSITNVPRCDFIIEISWRYLISEEIVNKASILAFGVHRGKLPEYAGSEPIKQALIKNENEIILSAHHLAEKIDLGRTICTLSYPVNYDISKTLEENIQRLRDEITPLFSDIVKNTIIKYLKK